MSLSSPGENTTSDCNASVTSDHDASVASSQAESRCGSKDIGIPFSNKGRTQDSGVGSSVGRIETSPKSDSDDINFQQDFDLLRENYELVCLTNEQLKNENLDLSAKLEKNQKRYKESLQAVRNLQAELKRKDTEIKAVLNFQKKLESRMSAFVEKEKNLAEREKSVQQLDTNHSESREAMSKSLVLHDLETFNLKSQVEKLEKDIAFLKEEKEENLKASTIELDQLRLELKKLKKRESIKNLSTDVNNIKVHTRKSFGVVWSDLLEVTFETAINEWHKYVALCALILGYFLLK